MKAAAGIYGPTGDGIMANVAAQAKADPMAAYNAMFQNQLSSGGTSSLGDASSAGSNGAMGDAMTGSAIMAAAQVATQLLGLWANKITANAQLTMQERALTAQAEQEKLQMENTQRDLGLVSANQTKVKDLLVAGNAASIDHAKARANRVKAESHEKEARDVAKAAKTRGHQQLDRALYSFGVPHVS